MIIQKPNDVSSREIVEHEQEQETHPLDLYKNTSHNATAEMQTLSPIDTKKLPVRKLPTRNEEPQILKNDVDADDNATANALDNQERTIEFSFWGITVKLSNLDTESFKIVLGTLLFLFLMPKILSVYNMIRRNILTSDALKKAEASFMPLIEELYNTLKYISPKDTNIIVFSDSKEQQYNLFEKKVIEIREQIKDNWQEYQGKIDPDYSQVIQRLYKNTILRPDDINLMKSAIDDLRFTGKKKRLLGNKTIKILEKISIELTQA